MYFCFQVNEGVPMAGRWASAQPYAGSGERPPRVRHEDNLKVVDSRGQKFEGKSVTKQTHDYKHGFQTPPAKVGIFILDGLMLGHFNTCKNCPISLLLYLIL